MSYRNSHKRRFPKSNSSRGSSSSIEEIEFISCGDCSKEQAYRCGSSSCNDQSCSSDSSRSSYSSNISDSDISDGSFRENKLEEDHKLLAEAIQNVVKKEMSSNIESKTTTANKNKKSLPTCNNQVSIL
jgi:hypothetical protein